MSSKSNYELTWKDIHEGLKNLGIRRGDTILVRSSLSSLGYVRGGAKAVIKALLKAVGEGGNIMVPTLTGTIKDCPENPPIFTIDKPCWTGAIPETLRKLSGSIRSLHPTHSVAVIGADAEYLTKEHERCETPCGVNSPYLKLAKKKGKILFLGVSLASNTMFHTVEELARVRYHLQPEPVIAQIVKGDSVVKVKTRLHAYGTPRAFREMETILEREGILSRTKIGRASVILIDAEEMIDYTLKLLKKDELAL